MKRTKLLVILWLGLTSVAGPGWAESRTEQPGVAEASLPKDGIVAEVNGQAITTQAFTKRASATLWSIAKTVYREKQFRLEAMIDDLLLQEEAERRQITREALVAEVTDAAHLVVSDVEAAEYYVNNADDFPEGQEAAKAKIHNLVREEKIQEKRQAFARSLRKNARIAIFLAPPSAQDATEPLSRPQPTTVAEVNGKKITARELDESVQPRPATLEPRFYLMKRRVLEEMINEVLSAEEAKKRGVSQEELFESVTQVTAVAIPEETIEKIYKRMTTKEKPADPQQLRNEIRRRLQRRQVKPQWEEFLQALKAKATIKINLPAPAFS